MVKKSLFFVAFTVLQTTTFIGHAQISTFKIVNGVQTPMKEVENFELTVDKDNHVTFEPNIMVQLDIPALRKKYNYDAITVNVKYKSSVYTFGYYNEDKSIASAFEMLEFDDPIYQKKYASQKTMKFYLFKSKEATGANVLSLINNNTFWFDPYWCKDSYQLLVRGMYKTGTEEYYDEKSKAWKKRTLYSEKELIQECANISFKMSDEWVFADNYKKIVNPGESVITDESGKTIIGVKILNSEFSKVKRSTVKFPLITQAINTVYDNILSTVNAETDQQKQMELVREWNSKVKFLMLDESFDPATLKLMNKELKTVTEVNAIIELFKKYNPNGKFSY